jgi:hypothetical protein
MIIERARNTADPFRIRHDFMRAVSLGCTSSRLITTMATPRGVSTKLLGKESGDGDDAEPSDGQDLTAERGPDGQRLETAAPTREPSFPIMSGER